MRHLNRLHTLLAIFILAGATAGRVEANPIVYTDYAIGSGSLGANAFTNALVTVSAYGDSANVTGGSGLFRTADEIVTVTVAGIGSATFTGPTYVFVNQGAIAAGFAGAAGSILDTFNAAFATYDLTSPIGPLSGAPFIRSDQTFATTLGGFNLSSAGTSTFVATAAAVPEPGSAPLLAVALGAMGLLGALRQRKQQQS